MPLETPQKASKSYWLDLRTVAKLERQAAKNRRSVSAELETILEKALTEKAA